MKAKEPLSYVQNHWSHGGIRRTDSLNHVYTVLLLTSQDLSIAAVVVDDGDVGDVIYFLHFLCVAMNSCNNKVRGRLRTCWPMTVSFK